MRNQKDKPENHIFSLPILWIKSFNLEALHSTWGHGALGYTQYIVFSVTLHLSLFFCSSMCSPWTVVPSGTSTCRNRFSTGSWGYLFHHRALPVPPLTLACPLWFIMFPSLFGSLLSPSSIFSHPKSFHRGFTILLVSTVSSLHRQLQTAWGSIWHLPAENLCSTSATSTWSLHPTQLSNCSALKIFFHYEHMYWSLIIKI